MFSNLTNSLVYATALLFFVKVVDTADYYCEMESCSNPKKHVFCLFPRRTISDRCKFLVRTGLMKNEKQALLKHHVQLREEYSARMKSRTKRITYPELFWDHDLAEVAQRWADQCNPKNDECRSIHDYGYVVKQNIGHYVVPHYPPHLRRSFNFNYSKIIKDWARTAQNPANPAVPKFRAIDRVGCGVTVKSDCDWRATYPSGSGYCLNFYHIFIVCNYSIFKMRLHV